MNTMNSHESRPIPKVIFIASSSFSGSTLLNRILSYHPGVIGVGEAFAVLRGRERDKMEGEKTGAYCSCGERLEECSFWSRYIESATTNGFYDRNYKSDYPRRYQALIDVVLSQGKEVIADSGKKRTVLKDMISMHEQGLLELKPIHLIRDMRGWVMSSASKRREAGQRVPYLRLFRHWYKKNRETRELLERSGIPFLTVTYERLCMDLDSTLADIQRFAGLQQNMEIFSDSPDEHLAFGNRMKYNQSGRLKVVYDSRWFNDYWINLWAALLPHMFRWNERNSRSGISCV